MKEKTIKILVNRYTSFRLSIEAYNLLKEWNSELVEEFKDSFGSDENEGLYGWIDNDEIRTHPDLIKCFKKLGEKINFYTLPPNDSYMDLVKIPADVKWYVGEDDDGSEYVCEVHRTW